MINQLKSYVTERISQHYENVRLWRSGFLDPTEPDEHERECVIRELEAAIVELEAIERIIVDTPNPMTVADIFEMRNRLTGNDQRQSIPFDEWAKNQGSPNLKETGEKQ